MDKVEITNLIKEIIEKTTVPVNEVSFLDEDKSNKGKMTWFSVDLKEPRFFLDNGAEALFALNHIVRKIIENKNPNKNNPDVLKESTIEFLIDVNGFQKKRVESIHAVAYMMAERARYFKSKVEIDPMPAFERRIVHEFLADAADLQTESEGVGPSRRVVIKYIGTI